MGYGLPGHPGMASSRQLDASTSTASGPGCMRSHVGRCDIPTSVDFRDLVLLALGGFVTGRLSAPCFVAAYVPVEHILPDTTFHDRLPHCQINSRIQSRRRMKWPSWINLDYVRLDTDPCG